MSCSADLGNAVGDVNQALDCFVEALEQALGDGVSEFVTEPRAITRLKDPGGHLEVVVIAYATKCPLTPRERDVARLIGHGLGTTGIAKRLRIQTKTVEKHVERIKAKWGMHTRAEIARYAAVLLAKDV